MRTSRKRFAGLCLALLAATAGCMKMKIDAQVTGYKPGDGAIVIVHVKTEPGARVTCSDSGLACPAISELPMDGEADIEFDLMGPNDNDKKKIVFINAMKGKREARTTIDFSKGLPPKLFVDSGKIKCFGESCKGELSASPLPHLTFEAAPGTAVDLGTDHFKAAATGKIDSPVNLTLKPALPDVVLSALCAEAPTTLGTTHLTITFPDQSTMQGDIELTTKRALTDVSTPFVLGQIKGPLPFAWEKPGFSIPKGQRAALFLDGTSCAGAPASATLSNVEVIALSSSQTRTGTCDYDLNAQKTGVSKGSQSGKLTYSDQLAVAYDRLSGQTLGSRLFQAPKNCTANFTTDASGSIPEQFSSVNVTSIATWALTLAK